MNQHTRNIIVDSLILVAFSSLLGGLSLLVSKSFSGDPNPALDLITKKSTLPPNRRRRKPESRG